MHKLFFIIFMTAAVWLATQAGVGDWRASGFTEKQMGEAGALSRCEREARALSVIGVLIG